MDVKDPPTLELDASYKAFPSFAEWQKHSTVETQRWAKSLEELTLARSESEDLLDRALEVAKRAAAFDTGAIEGLYETDRGFTFTVAQGTASWDLALSEKGENVRSLFEAQLNAYDLVLDFATRSEFLSEAAIRKLHEVVCAAQDTYRVATPQGFQEQVLPKGRYKVMPNHVRTRDGENHAYAPVDITPSEMHRLVGELRSEAFVTAHPIIQAAYAHYCFVAIHPFSDGNGRVARAIASVYTYRASSTPLMILSEQKSSYLDALEKADAGDFNAFVHFLLFRALDTFNLVIESFRVAQTPQREKFLEQIAALYQTRGGFTHERVDEIGAVLLETVADESRSQSSALAFAKISGQIQIDQFTGTTELSKRIPPTHRVKLDGTTRQMTLSLRAAPPIDTTITRRYLLALPKNASGEDDVLLVGMDDQVNARIDELSPTVSGVLKLKVKLGVERIINEMLPELLRKAAALAKNKL